MTHYDLAVIGSGSGNSIIDERFAGARVALIDDGVPFGGTCLNAGCIPTKMFVLPADLARSPHEAARLDVTLGRASVDWPALRDRIFGRIDPIAAAGEAYRASASGVDLFRTSAHFVGPRTLQVGPERLTADAVVLAAGSRPRRPDAVGVDDPALADRLHTSDTIMRLAALPASLLIVGGGYVAAEFAHVFASFGTAVTVAVRANCLLRHEDAEVQRRFGAEFARHVDVRPHTEAVGFAPRGEGVRVTLRDDRGVTSELVVDCVLLAVGRTPNADRLGAAAGGVEVDAGGFVVVDQFQRTTAPGVWAVGDVCSPWMLKHVANHEARVVQHNLLHPDDLRAADHRFVPHAVFSAPRVAAVGLTEDAARAAGLDVAVVVQEYASVAYGWALEDTEHCVKLLADRATGLLVGAHIVGPEAPDLLQPLVQAMSFGQPVAGLARGQYWIHPALSEVVENALLALEEEVGR